MEGGDWLRWCGSPEAALRKLAEWGEYLLGGKCMPEYRPTQDTVLELQRENLALALFGQLTVVGLRVATGHVGSGIVSLVIFALGNKARCSLQTSTLTTYVALGFSLSAVDASDLLYRAASLGTGFFVLPVEANVGTDLTSVASLLAPVAEALGAYSAWEALGWPRRALASRDYSAGRLGYHDLGIQVTNGDPYQALTPNIWAGHLPTPWQCPRQCWDSYMPPPYAGPHNVDLVVGAGTPGTEGGWPTTAVGQPADCCKALATCKGPKAPKELCAQCGIALREGEAWWGSGSFRDQAYCSGCWTAWTSAAVIG